MLKKTSLHSVNRPLAHDGSSQTRSGQQNMDLHHALSVIVENVYGLYQECLYYYWIVAGDDHVGLHEVFEKQYETLHETATLISNRMNEIGYQFSLTEELHLPSFPSNRLAVTSIQSMLSNTAFGHEKCSVQALNALEMAEAFKDKKTAALLIQAIIMHDKSAWTLRALNS